MFYCLLITPQSLWYLSYQHKYSWLPSLLGPEREFQCVIRPWGAIMISDACVGLLPPQILGARIVSWQAPVPDLCQQHRNSGAGGNTPDLKGSASHTRCPARPHLIFIAELVITQRVSTSNTAADISIEITNHSGVWSETSLGFPPSCSYRLFWVSEQSLTIWWS